MSTTEVKIPIEPFRLGDKTYTYVKVRAPSYHDYMDFGEPLERQRDPDGVSIQVQHLDRLKGYAERLVTTGDDAIAEPAVLAHGGFQLARRVHEVLCDFLYLQSQADGTSSLTS